VLDKSHQTTTPRKVVFRALWMRTAARCIRKSLLQAMSCHSLWMSSESARVLSELQFSIMRTRFSMVVAMVVTQDTIFRVMHRVMDPIIPNTKSEMHAPQLSLF
jgi:hypothetical protein